ncbi:AAA family ATPase [Desulfogranum mediterraneum]|uniref:AAA family ATPase n=1 Tax=Desulfogranum mediterraneum TaxID=160661 RepID=UPI00129470C7|nr:AAA family ATPase [Desulfogranum mediterraneum]
MGHTIGDILIKGKGNKSHNKTDYPFKPITPSTIEDTGLKQVFIEDLICKILLYHSSLSGVQLSRIICLPMHILEPIVYELKQRLILSYKSLAGINDFHYVLTESGNKKAILAREFTNYQGPAPVTYKQYINSVERQSLKNENPTYDYLTHAFKGLELSSDLYNMIGPAINSGRGMFIYGKPGNGKTEIGIRLSKCFKEHIYIPQSILIDGQLIQLYDPQCHHKIDDDSNISEHDPRWLKIERPSVVVGGEMDLESLEIGYNPHTKICEGPLQMKGNNGILLIDDFGRQRVSPEQILNRWILPLEKNIDYLTLPNGTKIKVPFNALLVFCSNLDPTNILDEALLRRIPYKIFMDGPDNDAFLRIFQYNAKKMSISYDPECVDYLIKNHFQGTRPMRGCHPRDILQQLKNIARFEGNEPCMTTEGVDRAAQLYFSTTGT